MGISILEIQNFKSYKGNHLIGPFKDFSCVIGPNGSGKSNIMDAIIFVLGHNSAQIRSTKLNELVNTHIATDKNNNEGDQSTYVAINFNHQGSNYRFSRKIIGNGSQYFFEQTQVSAEQYQKHLKDIGIDINTKNFFVFQGDVENIATQNPKQVSAFIEEVSGSRQLKQEYDRLLSEKSKCEDDVFTSYAKRKTIAFEKEQYKEQWTEVKEYQTMQDKVDSLKRDQQLAKLYQTTKEMRKEQKLLDDSKQQVQSIQSDEMKPLEQQYTQTSKNQASLHKEVVQLEDDISRLIKTKKKKGTDQYSAEEEIKYITEKIKKTKLILTKAENSRTKQIQEIDQLRNELTQFTEQLEKLDDEKEVAETGLSIKMDHQQIEEYNKLKFESGKETSSLKIKLDQLVREQRIEQDQQQQLTYRLEEFETMKKKFQETQEKFQTQKDFEQSNFQDLQQRLDELEKELQQSTTRFAETQKRQQQLNNDLERIQYSLSDLKSLKSENQRDRQFNQTVETLKSIFPGVKGKLMDLCEPSQRKYSTALTLTMGKLMDAIIVDTEETLIGCVRYLKEQLLGVATFISLDRLQMVKPINQQLRQIGGTAKLLFDCLKIQKGIEDAVLYALGNTVVCESMAEAKLLAFGGKERLKVITIQGIRITKSGLMSGGGLSSIKSKSSQWDNKRVEELKKQRDAILAELSDVIQLNEIFNQRQQLTSQVHQTKSDYSLSKSKIELLSDRLKKNQQELETNEKVINQTITPELSTLSDALKRRKSQIDQLQTEVNSIEEKYFSAFSKKFGVDNIREYEDNRLAKIQENIQKRLTLTESISVIQSRLDYEQGREIDNEIKQLSEELNANEKILGEELEHKKENDEKEKQFKESLLELQQQHTEKKSQLEKMNTTIKDLKKQLSTFNNQITDIEKLGFRHDFNITKLRGNYHQILVETRNEDIRLPILEFKGKEIDQGNENKSEGETDAEATKGNKKQKSKESEGEVDESAVSEGEGLSKKPKKPITKKKRSSTKRKREKDTNGEDNQQDDQDDEDDDDDIFNESDVEENEKPNLLQDIIKDITQTMEQDDILDIYQDEASIKFNYSTLKKRVFVDQKTYEEFLRKLTIDIETIGKDMKRVMPNYKAYEHLVDVSDKLKKVRRELNQARDNAKNKIDSFNRIRDQRKQLFMRAFKRIAKNLTSIYSELTRELEPPYHRGSAHLALEDTENPFNSGVRFTVIPPNKRFQEMDQLSGGEKSVAALAFLFSTHGLKSTPFMILDEIDAAFDSVNVLKLVRYVRHKASKDLQFLVISLKEQFFVHSDLLVGVCREPDSQSKSFHLLLEEFPESDEAKKALISKGEDETDEDGKTSATSGSSESEND
ncbi:hypothetical protein RB653_005154 [Dictyostelium firmibasis]|uniref:Structural maintenance of chromosomes protein n=1 Tax=Dictyostelium firmibasis TaxID=79012 RepID=A0AAN7U7A5_9MYCE